MWSNTIYPWNSRMLQYIPINVRYTILREWRINEERSYDHPNRYKRKPLTKLNTFPITKNNNTHQQLRYRKNVPLHHEGYIWQAQSEYHIQWWKVESFPLKSVTIQRCQISLLLFNKYWKFYPEQSSKKSKAIQIGKEKVNLSLCADYLILYVENPKD